MLNHFYFETILAESKHDLESTLHQIKREGSLSFLPGKATIIKGVRRAGKSVFAIQKTVSLKKEQEVICPIHFSDERLVGIASKEFQSLLEAAYKVYNLSLDSEIIFVFDEPQLVKGWELFCSRLIRNPKYKVVITGSSAKLLSKEIATEMRGRSLQYELFPFCFSEFLEAGFPNVDVTDASLANLNQIKKSYFEFLSRGGFPEIVLAPEKSQRLQIAQEYYDLIFYKDLIERNKINAIEASKAILKCLSENTAQLFTVNRVFEKVKSQGHKFQKSLVTEALGGLEDSYAFFQVPIFSDSIQRQQVNPKKIYCVDTGLIHSVSVSITNSWGRLLENAVFLELKRFSESAKIYYYKTETGHEVNFLYVTQKDSMLLIQVALEFDDEKTRTREFRAAFEGAAELGLKKAYLITLARSVELVQEGGVTLESIYPWQLRAVLERLS